MKNKIFFFGSLCLILMLGFVFTGCNNAQLVEFKTIGEPGNVKADYTSNTLKVTWDAVDGAYGYRVVASQEGKKSIIPISSSGSPVMSSAGAVADVDKWECSISSGYLPTGTFKVGVVAISVRNDINDSSPAWADKTVTIP